MYACFFSALLDVWLAARAQRWDTATLRHSVAHVSASCLSLRPNSAPSMDISHRVAFHVFNPSGLGISSDGLYACRCRRCTEGSPAYAAWKAHGSASVGAHSEWQSRAAFGTLFPFFFHTTLSACMKCLHTYPFALCTSISPPIQVSPPGMITRAACHRGGTLSIGAFASA